MRLKRRMWVMAKRLGRKGSNESYLNEPGGLMIRVSAARRIHILDGDATGGGHGPGRKISGKSEFPASLGDDEIIIGIEAIANDAASYPSGVMPTTPGRFRIRG